MTRIALIAALARGTRAIGKDGRLPWRLPADLKRFKRVTLGHPVIMGRKTHESIGRPLPGRTNIVLSRRPSFEAPGCLVAASLDQAIRLARGAERVFVIGGETVYEEALPIADELHLTYVDCAIEGDAHFPEFDASEWTETEREEHPADASHAHALTFVTLARVQAPTVRRRSRARREGP